jgi:hypothetical protein
MFGLEKQGEAVCFPGRQDHWQSSFLEETCVGDGRKLAEDARSVLEDDAKVGNEFLALVLENAEEAPRAFSGPAKNHFHEQNR